jgi:hypothetical protein
MDGNRYNFTTVISLSNRKIKIVSIGHIKNTADVVLDRACYPYLCVLFRRVARILRRSSAAALVFSINLTCRLSLHAIPLPWLRLASLYPAPVFSALGTSQLVLTEAMGAADSSSGGQVRPAHLGATSTGDGKLSQGRG